ncbi:E3 ubiquitin-protein ligase TRIM33-like, partial [Ruditapes philippinarum]|uniref:E3 ubiquitin-protein ligase TRIM33-like n=1 Tax=Ruditapes philippinarum TaxID=129788 RepID=UPI00295A5F99
MEVTGRKLESENISVLFCEPCEVENSKTSANGACRECKEHMCATCFRHHLKSKQCRNHVLLSLEEFSSLTLDCGSEDVIKCKKHDDENIKFYCRSHDVVGCGDCIVLEHTLCKPEYIKDLAKTFADEDVHKSIVKRVEDLRKMKSDYEQEIEKSKEEIGKMNEKALKDIREFRREINTCLDEAEANLLSEMKKKSKENTAKLEEIENGLQSL